MLRVVVADDSRVMRQIVVRTLRQAGYDWDITEATDGAEAFAIARAEQPDLVLSDWNMPNMSGTDLARALRALTDSGATVPILMVTARSVREDIIAALECGVNNYIVKPFTLRTLQDRVAAALDGKSATAI